MFHKLLSRAPAESAASGRVPTKEFPSRHPTQWKYFQQANQPERLRSIIRWITIRELTFSFILRMNDFASLGRGRNFRNLRH